MCVQIRVLCWPQYDVCCANYTYAGQSVKPATPTQPQSSLSRSLLLVLSSQVKSVLKSPGPACVRNQNAEHCAHALRSVIEYQLASTLAVHLGLNAAFAPSTLPLCAFTATFTVYFLFLLMPHFLKICFTLICHYNVYVTVLQSSFCITFTSVNRLCFFKSPRNITCSLRSFFVTFFHLSKDSTLCEWWIIRMSIN